MNEHERVRERRLRRKADRLGLALQKSRTRNPSVPDRGRTNWSTPTGIAYRLAGPNPASG